MCELCMQAQIQMLAKDLGEHCSTTPHNQEVYEENKKLKQRLEENERDQREKEEQIRELQTDRDELHRKLQTLLANKEEAVSHSARILGGFTSATCS